MMKTMSQEQKEGRRLETQLQQCHHLARSSVAALIVAIIFFSHL